MTKQKARAPAKAAPKTAEAKTAKTAKIAKAAAPKKAPKKAPRPETERGAADDGSSDPHGLVPKTYYPARAQAEALEEEARRNGLGGSALLRLILGERYNPDRSVSLHKIDHKTKEKA